MFARSGAFVRVSVLKIRILADCGRAFFSVLVAYGESFNFSENKGSFTFVLVELL